LIPTPPVLRERLAYNIRERRFLQTLLRLSIQASEELAQQNRPKTAQQKAVKS
jgi:hypothetical protein